MISDVLFEAVDEIDRYLHDMPDIYTEPLRGDIVKLRDLMDAFRQQLDTPPSATEAYFADVKAHAESRLKAPQGQRLL